MLEFDTLGIGEIGNGSRNFQYPVIGPVREAEAVHGLFDEIMAGITRSAILFDFRSAEQGIDPTASFRCPVSGFGHTGSDSGTDFFAPGGSITQDFMRYPGDFDMHVNPVEQRAGDSASIALYLLRGTMTAAAWIAKVSAEARVHRGNQLESGRETGLVRGAGYCDRSGFQRFSEDFQDFSVKFREFVQE